MSKFIKLSNHIININYIQSISIKPDKYYINVASNKMEGAQLNIAGFGFGKISSYNYEIKVCKTEHSTDYKIISDWINKQYF